MSDGSTSPNIFVVPASAVRALGIDGFRRADESELGPWFEPGVGRFLPRALAEDDPTHKQLIPYVILKSGDSVFCYTRGTSQGEARLHRLRSLGVGGHVDEADADGATNRQAFDRAVRRELEEEVDIFSPGVLGLVGLISDDRTPVGQVHVGIVFLYELDRPVVAAREVGLAEAGFIPLDVARAERARFESWSQLCLEFLFPESHS